MADETNLPHADETSTRPEAEQMQAAQQNKPIAQPAEGSAEAAESTPGSADPVQAAAAPVPALESAPETQAFPSTEAPSALAAETNADAGTRPADPAAADDVLTKRLPGHEAADALVLAESRKHTRRSFAVAAVAAAAGYGLYHYIADGPASDDQPIPRRDAFDVNAAVTRAITGDRALAPTYPLSRAETLRVNGIYGLKQELVPESYRLQLVGIAGVSAHPRYVPDVTAWEYRYSNAASTEDQGHDTKTPPPHAGTAEKMTPAPMVAKAMQKESTPAARPTRGNEEAGESDSTLKPGTPGLLLTMADVLQLPRHEFVTQFKCIEGWSQYVHWAGVRLRDFLDLYPPALVNGRAPKYVYMETPDGDYYTGYDLDICRHPQSLLVTEMMGAPLTQFHGAPLRLHMPTKYGYKQIKRIALIAYTDQKPDDYWTKLGYDWYAGL